MVLKTHLDCWDNEFFLSFNVQVVWEVTLHLTYLFIDSCIYLFHYVCILWLGITVCDLATLSSSEHVTAAMSQHPRWHFLVISCVLCIGGNDRYEHLHCCGVFDSVWVRKKTAQVTQ
jgi:hypothetical protein